MKAAWITTGFPANDYERSGANFLNELAERLSVHSKLSIFSLYYPPRSEYKYFNADVFSFGEKAGSKLAKVGMWRKCVRKFSELHSREKFGLIHSMWAGESGYVASRLSRKFQIPLIVNVCGGELAGLKNIGYGSRLKFWQKRFVDISLKTADKVVCGSNYIYNRVGELYGDKILEKTLKIPFGVDEKSFFHSKEKPFDRSAPVLINIASAVPVKSHASLFNAVKIVKEIYPGVRLLVYGHDDMNLLKEMSAGPGLSGTVEIKGFIDHCKIPEALKKADIFALSSLYESQNMALLEAAFCGLPVVSTDVGVAREITEHISQPGDHEMLASKILYVIENYESEKKKSVERLDELRKGFSLENSAEKFYDLYKQTSVKKQ